METYSGDRRGEMQHLIDSHIYVTHSIVYKQNYVKTYTHLDKADYICKSITHPVVNNIMAGYANFTGHIYTNSSDINRDILKRYMC